MILFCTVACFLVALSVPFEWGFEPALALLSIFFLALLMDLMTDFPVVATMAEVVVVIWALVAVLVGACPGDEMHDLFPGTGAVTEAWRTWKGKFLLPLEAAS